MIKYRYKLQLLAIFIFLIIMLFVKPDTVFVKVGGGSLKTYDSSAPIPSSEFDGYGGQQADRLAESYGAKVPEDCWQYVLGLE